MTEADLAKILEQLAKGLHGVKLEVDNVSGNVSDLASGFEAYATSNDRNMQAIQGAMGSGGSNNQDYFSILGQMAPSVGEAQKDLFTTYVTDPRTGMIKDVKAVGPDYGTYDGTSDVTELWGHFTSYWQGKRHADKILTLMGHDRPNDYSTRAEVRYNHMKENMKGSAAA